MSFEEEKKDVIKPADELQYAREGLVAGDWGELENCLQEFAKKIREQGISSNEKDLLRTELDSLIKDIEAVEIPQENKERDRVSAALEDAKSVL